MLGAGLLAAGAAINAAGGSGGHGHGHGHGNGHVCGGGIFARIHQAHCGRMAALHAGLNLSDGQRESVHETLKSRRVDIATAIKPVVVAKHALRDAVLADNPDDAAIRDAADVLGTSIGDAAVALAKIKVELVKNARLTPEQMKKIADFRAETAASVDALMSTILSEVERSH